MRINKPVRNFQKKKRNKYYAKDLKKSFVKSSDFIKNKPNSWLDGTFVVDAKTFECKHIPKN
jgi:hypothetical protein